MKLKVPAAINAIITKIDEKKINTSVYAALALCVLILGLCSFLFVNKVFALKKEMKKINMARKSTKELLMRDADIRQQREEVEKIIAQDKKFRLIKFQQELIDKFNLQAHKPEISVAIKQLENLRAGGYIEELRTIRLKSVNMKQVVEILNAIDKNERIFIRKVELSKTPNAPLVDLSFVMGTLNMKKSEEGEG